MEGSRIRHSRNKQSTNLTRYFFIRMEPFRPHINRRIDHTEHKVYFSFRITFRAFLGPPLPQLFAHKESVFSFQLLKRCIYFFSFMFELIMMVGSNFLDRCEKKYCGVGRRWSENHKYLFKAYVLKILFIVYICSYLSKWANF